MSSRLTFYLAAFALLLALASATAWRMTNLARAETFAEILNADQFDRLRSDNTTPQLANLQTLHTALHQGDRKVILRVNRAPLFSRDWWLPVVHVYMQTPKQTELKHTGMAISPNRSGF